jgi:RimJ/RimL family protein N-acetyltransferase
VKDATDHTRGPVRIRGARPSEDLTLLEIQRAASLAAFRHVFPPDQYPFPTEGVRKNWQEELASPDVRVLIAERSDQPIGAASYSAQRFNQLWVLPEEWGGGAAQALYAEVMRGLETLGGSPCRLWVLEQNQRARRFYERRGWRLDGRQTTTRYPPHPTLLGYSLDVGGGVLGGGDTFTRRP